MGQALPTTSASRASTRGPHGIRSARRVPRQRRAPAAPRLVLSRRGISAALPRPLAELARAGFGEVEFHLHHDGDTAETLAPRDRSAPEDVRRARPPLARRASAFRWAFIHGNWSLANGRPDGNGAASTTSSLVLHELGCYVDLTFPSAPDPCQPDKVNQIYWPAGDLTKRRSYEHGERARVGAHHDDRLLMITGPLALRAQGRWRAARERRDHRRRSADARRASRPGSIKASTSRAGPSGSSSRSTRTARSRRPPTRCSATAAAALHAALAEYMRHGDQLHYVTAREMFNVARAAMDGKTRRPERATSTTWSRRRRSRCERVAPVRSRIAPAGPCGVLERKDPKDA